MKKITSILLILITILSIFSNSFALDSAYIEDAGDIAGYDLMKKYDSGNWGYITVSYSHYTYNGKQYPAYCMNIERDGAYERGSYTVNIQSLLSDVRIWRTIINGYPYQSPSQMGVETWQDAYVATKQAVYCVLYDTDVENSYNSLNSKGEKIKNAIRNMVNEGRYGTRTPQSPNVTFSKVGNFVEDGDYYSQIFSVSSVVNMSEYVITSTNNMPLGGIITDLSNNTKTSFVGGENFKIKIPKSQLTGDISVTIQVQAKCETYPIFYGESPSGDLQNYAVTYEQYGTVSSETKLEVKGNNAGLQIKKEDKDTKENLQGVEFQVKSLDNTILATGTTNSQGVVTFNNLYPQQVKIVETKTKSEYILNTTETNATLVWGETKNITIENEHNKRKYQIN
jgi:hypothetical protein